MGQTASRRIVLLTANRREWLGPARLEEGPVCQLTNMANEIHDIVWKINQARRQKHKAESRKQKPNLAEDGEMTTEAEFREFRWKQNGLRHSFVSCRVAEIQNVEVRVRRRTKVVAGRNGQGGV